jgi:hypothetical protein
MGFGRRNRLAPKENKLPRGKLLSAASVVLRENGLF